MANLGEAGAGDQSYVARSNNRQPHALQRFNSALSSRRREPLDVSRRSPRILEQKSPRLSLSTPHVGHFGGVGLAAPGAGVGLSLIGTG
jgi:hypothetical protein